MNRLLRTCVKLCLIVLLAYIVLIGFAYYLSILNTRPEPSEIVALIVRPLAILALVITLIDSCVMLERLKSRYHYLPDWWGRCYYLVFAFILWIVYYHGNILYSYIPLGEDVYNRNPKPLNLPGELWSSALLFAPIMACVILNFILLKSRLYKASSISRELKRDFYYLPKVIRYYAFCIDIPVLVIFSITIILAISLSHILPVPTLIIMFVHGASATLIFLSVIAGHLLRNQLDDDFISSIIERNQILKSCNEEEFIKTVKEYVSDDWWRPDRPFFNYYRSHIGSIAYIDSTSKDENERTTREIEGIQQIVTQYNMLEGASGTDVIFDVPCGYGRHTQGIFDLAKHKVVGIDIDPKSLNIAKKKNRVLIKDRHAEFFCVDMRSLHESDVLSQFSGRVRILLNLYTSFGFFSNDNENSTVLSSWSRMLKPGGYCIIHYDFKPTDFASPGYFWRNPTIEGVEITIKEVYDPKSETVYAVWLPPNNTDLMLEKDPFFQIKLWNENRWKKEAKNANFTVVDIRDSINTANPIQINEMVIILQRNN